MNQVDQGQVRLKIVLVTSFEEYFLEQDTLPALTRRGVQVIARFEARHVESYDLDKFREMGVTMILHMHEVGGHDSSRKLSEKARLAGLPIRALSRKKASWTFLPAPIDEDPPASVSDAFVLDTEGRAYIDAAEVEKQWSDGGDTRLYPGPECVDPEGAPPPPPVKAFFTRHQFDRKTARLRDIIRLLIAHGITDPARALVAVLDGRQNGTFPRLIRLRTDDLPKLVRTTLEHEIAELRAEKQRGEIRALSMYEEDRPALERLGLPMLKPGVAHVDLPKEPIEEPMNTPEPLPAPPAPALFAHAQKVALMKLGRMLAPLYGDEPTLTILRTARQAGLTLDELIAALEEP